MPLPSCGERDVVMLVPFFRVQLSDAALHHVLVGEFAGE